MTPKALQKKYPDLFRECYDFYVGKGWMKIVAKLCQDIEEIKATMPKKDAKKMSVVQIKEKFGGLRFYMTGRTTLTKDDPIQNLIFEAQDKCSETCEECGKPGTIKKKKSGWLKCLCPECRKKDK